MDDLIGEFPLVRIRNPWGNEAEWNGPWSDGSEEWNYVPEEEKEIQGIVFDDDGEFFMSIDDFVKVKKFPKIVVTQFF